MGHKTILDKDFRFQKSDYEFDYQKNLTQKLDNNKSDFTQDTLNEIVLWKVNRYAQLDKELINLINSIDKESLTIDIEKTKAVLKFLLDTKGVQLAMASTILRFKNNKIYQIIDQRVYRIIYSNQELILNTYPSEKKINSQIELYIKYLADLKKVCSNLKIPFEKADRILFMADRRINKKHKLKTKNKRIKMIIIRPYLNHKGSFKTIDFLNSIYRFN